MPDMVDDKSWSHGRMVSLVEDFLMTNGLT